MEYTRDEYGNPIRTDEYGNPLPVNQGYGIGAGAATKEQHHCGGTGGLHRSGSSSSVSPPLLYIDSIEAACTFHSKAEKAEYR